MLIFDNLCRSVDAESLRVAGKGEGPFPDAVGHRVHGCPRVRSGFTLIEMLVVIGIIAVLTGATVTAFSKMTRSADQTRARELVSNVATALQVLYQKEGSWPKKIVTAADDNLFDENAGLVLAKKSYLSLAMNDARTKLIGYDRFGVVTPWAVTTIKSHGNSVSLSTKVGSSTKTIRDHILRFAIDTDGDGFTELPGKDVGDDSGKRVRATACVWCCSKDGSFEKRNVIASWSTGQVAK